MKSDWISKGKSHLHKYKELNWKRIFIQLKIRQKRAEFNGTLISGEKDNQIKDLKERNYHLAKELEEERSMKVLRVNDEVNKVHQLRNDDLKKFLKERSDYEERHKQKKEIEFKQIKERIEMDYEFKIVQLNDKHQEGLKDIKERLEFEIGEKSERQKRDLASKLKQEREILEQEFMKKQSHGLKEVYEEVKRNLDKTHKVLLS